MFRELKAIVDIIRSAASDIGRLKERKNHEEMALDLLRVYFLFYDCVKEGEDLLAEAGPDPVKTVEAMEQWSALSTLDRWEAILKRQSLRLRMLMSFISGQHHLTVANPSLKKDITDVIGSKFERANSLHAIGSALFFMSIFPIETDSAERAKYVAVMAGAKDRIDMVASDQEIANLRESLDAYRGMIERFLSYEEMMRLSNQARIDTYFEPSPKMGGRKV